MLVFDRSARVWSLNVAGLHLEGATLWALMAKIPGAAMDLLRP